MQPGACEIKIRIEHELVKEREEETRRLRGRRCRVRGWKKKKKKCRRTGGGENLSRRQAAFWQ